MLIRFRDERGVAMIVALMVTFVVLLFGVIIVAQSIHNSTASGYDRDRLSSVNAAEAGLNYFYRYLQGTTAPNLSCTDVTQTVGSAPTTASWTASVQYYSSSGALVSCPFTDASYPAEARITSVANVDGKAVRTMQTAVKLHPIFGGFQQAVLSNSSTTFGNYFNIFGNNGNNGDVYVNSGNLLISNTPAIHGNVYVPFGGATITGANSQVQGNLWTRDSVTIDTPAQVTGNLTSSTGSIGGSGGGTCPPCTIGGNATAATTIGASLTVGGSSSPNTPSPNPPSVAFPQITYTTSEWTNPPAPLTPFTEVVFSGTVAGRTACDRAQTWVETAGNVASNTVVRITGTDACTYSNSPNATVNLNGNLAIVTDWGIDLRLRSSWNGITSLRNLYFISVSPENGCPATGTTSKTLKTGNNTDFNSLVYTFFYTPCTAQMNNQNAFSGQVIAKTVDIGNQFTMTYQPLLVPGFAKVTGFNQDIVYVREVAG